ncbi:hypothetical protein EV202_10460 [Bacteroides heparinolyticus]|uniref:Uncharacterized protein n=1 Tax=Prevotella heparinolytica TaxID=28113 RepID=A0A4R2LVB4_9BACE|nr:hypothetical protein EV202_10460 [Bacteroides heparinolyticus]
MLKNISIFYIYPISNKYYGINNKTERIFLHCIKYKVVLS